MPVAYVALGANLNDPPAQLRRAARALAALPHTVLDRCSSLYRSAPVGITAQPVFYNGVCRLTTRLAPHALLGALLAIETAARRRRSGARGGPRTLDLDLLLYGRLRLRRRRLSLPHPRLHRRAFVLYPLAEIAPELRIPMHGPVRHLLIRCATSGIERLPARLDARDER